ncbi:MAG: hypothetical protein LH473_00665 [Chitinophagales bacterium]|nr:hypothetical protein [Chitinophagales bacterium]
MVSRKLVREKSFEKAYKKFTRNNHALKKKVDQALHSLEQDASSKHLQTHQLIGKLKGLSACSCGYECRIVFSIEKDKND